MPKKTDRRMRTEIEIIGDLVNLANGGSLKYNLRMRANLDAGTFGRYEAVAQRLGLIAKSYEKKSPYTKDRRVKFVYHATERGLEYAHYYNSLMEMLGDDRR